MADNGWIKLWRKSQKNPLYFKEPFDKWHAWQDLLLMAEYEGKDKGKLLITLKKLKNRWFWGSTYKVLKFLENLKENFMIDFQSTRGRDGKTTITIKNYEVYQTKKKTAEEPKKEGEKNFYENTRRNTSLLREEVISNTTDKSVDGKQDEYFDPSDLIRRKEGKGE